jgi:hypothetical protein
MSNDVDGCFLLVLTATRFHIIAQGVTQRNPGQSRKTTFPDPALGYIRRADASLAIEPLQGSKSHFSVTRGCPKTGQPRVIMCDAFSVRTII